MAAQRTLLTLVADSLTDPNFKEWCSCSYYTPNEYMPALKRDLTYDLILKNARHIVQVNGQTVFDYLHFSETFSCRGSMIHISNVRNFNTVLIDWDFDD